MIAAAYAAPVAVMLGVIALVQGVEPAAAPALGGDGRVRIGDRALRKRPYLFTSALLAIVGTTPKRDLALAMTLFAAVTLLAPTVSPLYADIALQLGTWRGVFAGFALPATVAAILAHLWTIDESAPRAQAFDRTTFVVFLVGLTSYQFLVNRGASVGWFARPSAIVQGAAFTVVPGRPLASTLFNAVDGSAFATLAVLFKLSFLIGSGLTFRIAATLSANLRPSARAATA